MEEREQYRIIGVLKQVTWHEGPTLIKGYLFLFLLMQFTGKSVRDVHQIEYILLKSLNKKKY